MNALLRLIDKIVDSYKSMSPGRRGTLIAVPALTFVALLLLVPSSRSSQYVPLSWGKAFDDEELNHAVRTLRESRLTDFRIEDHRLMVPAAEAGRYNAALLEGAALPTDWGAELEKQFEHDGIFSSHRGRQTRKDIALAKELGRVIRAVPGIKDANVIWARSQDGRHWSRRKGSVTATVSVLPHADRQLSLRLMESLRTAVAGMVPDLNPADVTIFDQSTGISHSAQTKEASLRGKLLKQVGEIERLHRDKITSHLSAYIPGVVVSVNVEPESLPSSLDGSSDFGAMTATAEVHRPPKSDEAAAASNRPLELGNQADPFHKQPPAPVPQAVHVSVGIPHSYYRQVALRRRHPPGASGKRSHGNNTARVSEVEIRSIERQVKRDVKATVAKLISRGSPETSVNVSSYTPVGQERPSQEASVAAAATEAGGGWANNIGLGLFTSCLVCLLLCHTFRRSQEHAKPHDTPAESRFARSPTEQGEPDLDESAVQNNPPVRWSADPSVAESAEVEEPRWQPSPLDLAQRERLQSVVGEDSERAASVLTNWIQTAS